MTANIYKPVRALELHYPIIQFLLIEVTLDFNERETMVASSNPIDSNTIGHFHDDNIILTTATRIHFIFASLFKFLSAGEA